MMQKLNEEGLMVEAPYDAKVLAFVHEDFEVRNPFVSQCGRFNVDPAKEYGFKVVGTGGGCQALDRELPDGGFIRLTDEDGCNLPDIELWEDALIGRYNAEGEQIACCVMRDVKMAHEEDAATE